MASSGSPVSAKKAAQRDVHPGVHLPQHHRLPELGQPGRHRPGIAGGAAEQGPAQGAVVVRLVGGERQRAPEGLHRLPVAALAQVLHAGVIDLLGRGAAGCGRPWPGAVRRAGAPPWPSIAAAGPARPAPCGPRRGDRRSSAPARAPPRNAAGSDRGGTRAPAARRPGRSRRGLASSPTPSASKWLSKRVPSQDGLQLFTVRRRAGRWPPRARGSGGGRRVPPAAGCATCDPERRGVVALGLDHARLGHRHQQQAGVAGAHRRPRPAPPPGGGEPSTPSMNWRSASASAVMFCSRWRGSWLGATYWPAKRASTASCRSRS